ncbi:MAG: metalloregulator ArsR/SmtB family transcription factor [Verrucomicrobia bacterium]|jgi:ArsR family transcriptional regulator|nr:metalloregulator ArsR/SmtB family transcription factor [Verrucomicrobiota bacterium]
MTVAKSKSGRAGMSPAALELIAARFRVLGEASRLRLIQALHGSERSVNELAEAAGLTQANASRHLQTLTEAGILKRRKQGLQVLYSIADPDIFSLCEHVCGSVQQRIQAHARAFGGSARAELMKS